MFYRLKHHLLEYKQQIWHVTLYSQIYVPLAKQFVLSEVKRLATLYYRFINELQFEDD